MGSWFSSPAAGDSSGQLTSLIPIEHMSRRISKEMLARSGPQREYTEEYVPPFIISLLISSFLQILVCAPVCVAHFVFSSIAGREVYAGCICWLAHRALKHYNANNPVSNSQATSSVPVSRRVHHGDEGLLRRFQGTFHMVPPRLFGSPGGQPRGAPLLRRAMLRYRLSQDHR
jgi:hypothetical protein